MWIQRVLLLLTAAVAPMSSTSFSDEDDQLERLSGIRRASDEAVHREKRIVGGKRYPEGKWPHLVRLQGKCPQKFWWGIPRDYTYYYCGGAIINMQWVLTAAHCFKGQGITQSAMTAKYWHINAGELKVKRFIGWWDNKPVHGDQIFIHPDYDEEDLWLHDIALVKLEKQLPSDDANIQPVTLPCDGTVDAATWPPPAAACYVKGWGCTSTGGALQEYAREVLFSLISDSACRSVYGISGNTRVCAGNIGSNRGICGGDSGGPLVCKNGDEWTLAGVASFTSAVNLGYYPSVFGRVTEYCDWIQNTINNN